MPEPTTAAPARRGEWSLIALALGAGTWAMLEPQTSLSAAAAAAYPAAPRLAAAAVVLVGGAVRAVQLLLLLRRPAGSAAASPSGEEIPVQGRLGWRTAGVLGLLVLPAVVLPFVGMVATGVLLIAGVALAVGARSWWRPWAVAAAVVVPLWLVLTQLLGVYLPLWPGM